MGKGSSPRPYSVSQEEFGNNFDRIFGKKKRDEDPKPQPVDQDEQAEGTVRDSEQGG